MTNFFVTGDGKTELEVEVLPENINNGQNILDADKYFKLSKALERTNSGPGTTGPVHVYAFRFVQTAGFAIPLAQLIMSSNKKDELEQFKKGSRIRVSYGNTTDSKNKRIQVFQTIGYHIQKSKQQDDMYILKWGGVLTTNKNSTLPKSDFEIEMEQREKEAESKASAKEKNDKNKALNKAIDLAVKGADAVKKELTGETNHLEKLEKELKKLEQQKVQKELDSISTDKKTEEKNKKAVAKLTEKINAKNNEISQQKSTIETLKTAADSAATKVLNARADKAAANRAAEEKKQRVQGAELNKKFLEESLAAFEKQYYEGAALDVLQDAWTDMVGTDVIFQKRMDDPGVTESMKCTHKYKVFHRTRQNFLLEVFLHVDLRPSFPMAAIDEKGRLLVKDFLRTKYAGPTAIFVPDSNTYRLSEAQKKIGTVIQYAGMPEPLSFRSQINRALGYAEVKGTNITSGDTIKFASDVVDPIEEIVPEEAKTSKWSISNLNPKKLKQKMDAAVTRWNNTQLAKRSASAGGVDTEPSDKEEPEVTTITKQVVVSGEIPRAFHEVCMYNTRQLVNMSAVQVRLRVPEKFLGDINVLDYVEVRTGNKSDRADGYWLVEAIESGFVNGASNNVVYLCRDYMNAAEQGNRSTFLEKLWRKLRLPSSAKVFLTNVCENARGALTVLKGILNARYLSEVQAYLISVKAGALSNFNLFGNSINLSSAINRTVSLRNTGDTLIIRLFTSLLKDPYGTFLADLLTRNATSIVALIQLILSAIVGGTLTTAISMLIADLRAFNIFFDNYSNTLRSASQEANPKYVAAVTAGTIRFVEQPDGTLEEVVTGGAASPYITPTRIEPMKQTPEEILEDIKQDIIEHIVANIPEDIDIPIPEIVLEESDIHKDYEEVYDNVCDTILEDLIIRDYIYDSEMLEDNPELLPPGASATDEVVSINGKEKLTTTGLKSIFKGETEFTPSTSRVMKNAVSNVMKIRHWGTFTSFDDLTSFRIKDGYVDKYKTVGATKRMTCMGQRIFVALPADEEAVKFYVNSERCYELEQNTIEIGDIGHYYTNGSPIPYIIYYTTTYYDSVNLVLEIRKN